MSCRELCRTPVECATCARPKKPIGRPSRNADHCNGECPGYYLAPEPGHLWPDEPLCGPEQCGYKRTPREEQLRLYMRLCRIAEKPEAYARFAEAIDSAVDYEGRRHFALTASRPRMRYGRPYGAAD